MIANTQTAAAMPEGLNISRAGFDFMDTAKFKCRTFHEAQILAEFISQFFPDSYRVLSGVHALLINAIEHGNLGIGYTQKSALLAEDVFQTEILRLLALPENLNKTVSATVVKKDDGVYLVIEDMGTGFAWKNFLQIDPSRAGAGHGRGIAKARTMSFDKLTYNEQGNQAVAFVSVNEQFEW